MGKLKYETLVLTENRKNHMKKHTKDYAIVKKRIQAVINAPDYVFKDKDFNKKETSQDKERICFFKFYDGESDKPFIKIVVELNRDDTFDGEESHDNNIVTGYFTGRKTVKIEFDNSEENLIYEEDKSKRNKHLKGKNRNKKKKGY